MNSILSHPQSFPRRSIRFGILMSLATSVAHADLIVHWKLDEANGDHTTVGYFEQVSGSSTIAREIAVGTDVVEGQTGIAPGGGTSSAFTAAGSETYIDAGSVEDDGGEPGEYVSGAAGAPYILGSNFTISAWFNTNSLSGEHIMFSNRFNSNAGILVGTRGGNILMDFGNVRAQYTPSPALETGKNYLIVVRQDPGGDTNLGWVADSNHRISLYDVANEVWQHFDGTTQKNGLYLNEMSIGRFTNGGREWDGTIDDVRVYGHTLTQDDLDELVEPSSSVPFRITEIKLLPGDQVQLTWNSTPEAVYTIFWSTDGKGFDADAGDDFASQGESTTVVLKSADAPISISPRLLFRVGENAG